MDNQNQQKKIILNLLSNIVNGQNIKEAEAKIKEYESQPGFATALLSVLYDTNVDDTYRQQSGVILKNVLTAHWEPTDPKFELPELTKQEKDTIKTQIIKSNLIADNNSKIRKATAMIVSLLAEYDFPEEWPQLLPSVVSYLNTSISQTNVNLLSGTICCLRYFVDNICDIQIEKVLAALFPILLTIGRENNVPYEIREQTIQIYEVLLGATLDMREQHKQLVGQLLNPSMNEWLKLLNDILNSNNSLNANNMNAINSINLKIQALHTLMKITFEYPISLKQCLGTLLSSLWNTMMFGMNLWQFLAIMNSQEQLKQGAFSILVKNNPNYQQIGILSHVATSGDELYSQVIRLLDFSFQWIEMILMHRKESIRSQLNTKLREICRILVRLLMLSHQDLELYNTDSNAFAVQEDEKYGHNSTLRLCMRMIIKQILDSYGHETLLETAQELLKSSENSLKNNLSWWWREREAAILVFGHFACAVTDIEYELDVKKIGFDANEFVLKILWPHINTDSSNNNKNNNNGNNEYLRSRCLWTLRDFIEILSFNPKLRDPKDTRQIIYGICNCLQANRGGSGGNNGNGNNGSDSKTDGDEDEISVSVTRLGAVKCISTLLTLDDNNNRFEINKVVKEMLHQILPVVCQIIGECDQTTLFIVLELIDCLLQLSEDVITLPMNNGNNNNNNNSNNNNNNNTILDNIVPIILDAWKRHNNNETCLEFVERTVETIMTFPKCISRLRALIIPNTIIPILDHAKEVESGVLQSALTMLHILMIVPKSAKLKIRKAANDNNNNNNESKSAEQSNCGTPLPNEMNVQLPTEYIDNILPRIIRLVLSTDDHEAMNCGSIVIADCVRINPDYVYDMTVNTGNNNNNNNNNNSGNTTKVMDGIFQVIAKLLHPSVKETAAMKVGSLITQVIVSLGNKIPQNTFTQMLITVIQRLILADFSELKQSLVLIFARLVNIYDKTIIDFLANYQCNNNNNNNNSNNNNNNEKGMLLADVRIANPDFKPNYQVNLSNNNNNENNNPNGIMNFKRMDDGTNKQKKIVKQQIHMLTYIMREWVTVHNELMFPYQKKVSATAFCKLLQTGDNRLNNVICDGYPNVNINERRTTRSISAQRMKMSGFNNNNNNNNSTNDNYTQMALPCKLVSLIVQTWSDVCNDTESQCSDFDDESQSGTNFDTRSHASSVSDNETNNSKNKNNTNGKDSENDDDDEWQPSEAELVGYKNQQSVDKEWLQFAIGDIGHGMQLGKDETVRNFPESENDPILDLDLDKFIHDFLTEFSRKNKSGLETLAKHLNKSDQDTLVTIIQQGQ